MSDTDQGFPLEKGRGNSPKIVNPKRKTWGVESEYTKALREKSLDNIVRVGCEVCGIKGRRQSARRGIAWFSKHQETLRHKRNVEKRKNG